MQSKVPTVIFYIVLHSELKLDINQLTE